MNIITIKIQQTLTKMILPLLFTGQANVPKNTQEQVSQNVSVEEVVKPNDSLEAVIDHAIKTDSLSEYIDKNTQIVYKYLGSDIGSQLTELQTGITGIEIIKEELNPKIKIHKDDSLSYNNFKKGLELINEAYSLYKNKLIEAIKQKREGIDIGWFYALSEKLNPKITELELMSFIQDDEESTSYANYIININSIASDVIGKSNEIINTIREYEKKKEGSLVTDSTKTIADTTKTEEKKILVPRGNVLFGLGRYNNTVIFPVYINNDSSNLKIFGTFDVILDSTYDSPSGGNAFVSKGPLMFLYTGNQFKGVDIDGLLYDTLTSIIDTTASDNGSVIKSVNELSKATENNWGNYAGLSGGNKNVRGLILWGNKSIENIDEQNNINNETIIDTSSIPVTISTYDSTHVITDIETAINQISGMLFVDLGKVYGSIGANMETEDMDVNQHNNLYSRVIQDIQGYGVDTLENVVVDSLFNHNERKARGYLLSLGLKNIITKKSNVLGLLNIKDKKISPELMGYLLWDNGKWNNGLVFNGNKNSSIIDLTFSNYDITKPIDERMMLNNLLRVNDDNINGLKQKLDEINKYLNSMKGARFDVYFGMLRNPNQEPGQTSYIMAGGAGFNYKGIVGVKFLTTGEYKSLRSYLSTGDMNGTGSIRVYYENSDFDESGWHNKKKEFGIYLGVKFL